MPMAITEASQANSVHFCERNAHALSLTTTFVSDKVECAGGRQRYARCCLRLCAITSGVAMLVEDMGTFVPLARSFMSSVITFIPGLVYLVVAHKDGWICRQFCPQTWTERPSG